MSKMFDANVKHYKEKYHNMIDNISRKSLDAYIKSSGVTDEFFKAGFEENSEQFRQFVLTFAKTLMPGHVSCTTYAAVVSVIAEKYGVAYQGYAGFCLPKSHPRYEVELGDFNKRKGSDQHPALANHVYTEIDGKIYEFFNGNTSDIDHIDCITI